MLALFLSRYWQQLAVVGICVAAFTLGAVWLHHDRAVHEGIGEARIQEQWDEAKVIQQAAADKQNAINRGLENDQRNRADAAERALEVANATSAAATLDWQRRIDRLRANATSAATRPVPTVFNGTDQQYTDALKAAVIEGADLLGQYRSIAEQCSAEVTRYITSWPAPSPTTASDPASAR